MSDVFSAYCALEPDAIACDGEATQSQMAQRRRTATRALHNALAELGEPCTFEQAIRWFDENEKAV